MRKFITLKNKNISSSFTNKKGDFIIPYTPNGRNQNIFGSTYHRLMKSNKQYNHNKNVKYEQLTNNFTSFTLNYTQNKSKNTMQK